MVVHELGPLRAEATAALGVGHASCSKDRAGVTGCDLFLGFLPFPDPSNLEQNPFGCLVSQKRLLSLDVRVGVGLAGDSGGV